MGLFVSTTGTDVVIPELGITISHPTTEKQLDAQFTAEDIRSASSLTSAIQGGQLTWKKTSGGSNELGSSYDSEYLELSQEEVGGYSSFGSYFYNAKDDSESSTSSKTVFLSKLTLVTDSLPLGDYIVMVRYKFRTANANRTISVRLLRNTVQEIIDEPFTAANTDKPFKIFNYIAEGISGVQTFEVQFKSGSGLLGTGTTVYLSQVSVMVWRIR